MKTKTKILSTIFIALVLVAWFGGQASALSVPGHLMDVQWPSSSPAGYSDMSVDIKVENVTGDDGIYYSHTIYLNGTNTDNAEPNIMYGCFQTVGYTGSSWIGKMALFSVWGVSSGSAEPGGWGTTFGGEGVGYSVRIAYEWQVGRTYRLSFRIISQDATNYTYAAYLKDMSSGVETRIGRIPIPLGRGKMYSPVSFHEIYGFNGTSPAVCTDISTSQVTFTSALADGQSLSPNVYYVNSYGECAGRNKSSSISGGVRSTFGDILASTSTASPTTPAPANTPAAPAKPKTNTTVAPATPVIAPTEAKPTTADNSAKKATAPTPSVVRAVKPNQNKKILFGLGVSLLLVVSLGTFVFFHKNNLVNISQTKIFAHLKSSLSTLAKRRA